MSNEEHAKLLRPSSAGEWVHCPAAPKLQAAHPQGDTEASKEGDAVHWMCAVCLTERTFTPDALAGQKAPNGVLVTNEMAKHAGVYVDAVEGHCMRRGLFHGLNVERKVQVPRVHAECWGTPDSDAYDDNRKVLNVWDFKYGWGLVEVYENWQMITYALGLLDRIKNFGNPNFSDQEIYVNMVIVQPRPYHPDGSIRSWYVNASELRGYANQLEFAASKAMGDDAETVTGPHCRYCTARHVCPAAHRAAMGAIDVIDQNIPHALDAASLAYTIQTLRRVKDIASHVLDAHEEQAKVLLRNGGRMPIYGLTSGRGRQVWARSKKVTVGLGEMYGVDLKKPYDVKTPKQAIEAGMAAEVVQQYSTHNSGETKLIELDQLAKKAFSK